MGVALRLRNQPIHRHHMILYSLRQAKMPSYNMFNIMQPTVMMVMVVMSRFVAVVVVMVVILPYLVAVVMVTMVPRLVAVVMVLRLPQLVAVVMAFLLLAIYRYCYVGSRDPTFYG